MPEKSLICDGEFEIVRLTKDLYDEAEELFIIYFLRTENIAVATKLYSTQEGIDEILSLFREMIKDGISFGVRDCKTQKLVSIGITKIINSAKNACIDKIMSNFKTPAMICICDYLERMESTFDLFKEWNIDCALEIEFLATNSNYGRKGLAYQLSNHIIDYVRGLLRGTHPETELEKLPTYVRSLRPQVVCAVFTSRFSQKVGEKLGFKTVNTIAHKDLFFDGKTFAESMDPIHEISAFAALRL